MNTTTALIYWIFIIASFIASLIGLYKVFEKSGEQGWKALVPVYNYFIVLQLVGKSKRWRIWIFVPIINFVIPLILIVELCKSFKRESLGEQTLAMLFPYAYLLWLGFNKERIYYGQPKNLELKSKSGRREWADAIVFAIIAATIIRTFFIEAYKIPTPSMENSMLVGDHLFVSKFHYGARFPITPLAVPLAHHTVPGLNIKAFLDWIQLPYFRFPGLETIERNDVVVFNFPEGDTVWVADQGSSFYSLKRTGKIKGLHDKGKGVYAERNQVGKYHEANIGDITVRPIDKRENYVKRCIAIPGDNLEIKNQVVYINGEKRTPPPGVQFSYTIQARYSIPDSIFHQLGIIGQNVRIDPSNTGKYTIHTSYENAEILKSLPQVTFITENTYNKNQMPGMMNYLFPFDPLNAPFTIDNFGPIHIPKSGESINLTMENVAFYDRIISFYENNDFEIHASYRLSLNDSIDKGFLGSLKQALDQYAVKHSTTNNMLNVQISNKQGNLGHKLEILCKERNIPISKSGAFFINGKEIDQYVFKYNYYFMMGDNRHNSQDSRFWGFVPEDHIVGKAWFVWFSWDADGENLFKRIRWNRFFKFVN